MSDRIRNVEDPPREPQQPAPGRPEPSPAPPPPRRPPPPPEPPPLAATGEGDEPLPSEAPSDPAAVSDEQQKRIDRLTWEKYEAKRRADEAERMLAQERQQRQRPVQQPNAYAPPDPQADAEARGYQRAQEDLDAQRFNEACDGLYRRGVAEFGPDSMTENVRRLQEVGWGAPNDPEGIRALRELIKLPQGHKVYAALASDLDNAYRIRRLDPTERQMELAMMAHAANGTAAPSTPLESISRAPAPLRTISANSRQPQKPLEKMTMSEFIRTRDREGPGPSARIRRG